jgi:hypothetical protein
MRLIEGTIGDPTKNYSTITTLNERVFVGPYSYTVQALLRGFRLAYAGNDDRHIKYIQTQIRAYTLADDPGYVLLTTTVVLQDELSVFSLGDENVNFEVDYTLLVV